MSSDASVHGPEAACSGGRGGGTYWKPDLRVADSAYGARRGGGEVGAVPPLSMRFRFSCSRPWDQRSLLIPSIH
jgi:hypothetical protein